jgi:hypothetical protein
MTEKETVFVDKDLEYLVPDYLDSKRKDAALIHDFIRKEDFESIRIIGHNMKGTGGGYGFEAISVMGTELESAAINRNVATIARIAGDLLAYIERIDIVYI